MENVKNGKKVEIELLKGETFEDFIKRNIVIVEEIKLGETIKEVMKLRDSGRVCFLENMKKYEETKEEIFIERCKKYLNRYLISKSKLDEIREIEKSRKVVEFEKNCRYLKNEIGCKLVELGFEDLGNLVIENEIENSKMFLEIETLKIENLIVIEDVKELKKLLKVK